MAPVTSSVRLHIWSKYWVVHEIWLFMLVPILIGWFAKMGATVVQVQATTMVIFKTLDEFTLVDDSMKGSEAFQCIIQDRDI